MIAEVGSVYHGLRLLSYCGGGAYGDVYYCRDLSGRELAVKIVSKQKLCGQWERELRGVANYRKITENAPGLLQIYHVEEDGDSFFYTMEAADSARLESYLPDTLGLRLKNGPLPQRDVFRILSGIFAGIKTIHQAGFAHRDIKPDNILFVKGKPKLADIGLISSLTATMTGMAGTLDFLPPELLSSGDAGIPNCKSRQRNDLYAFGKVIYCAVTGQESHAWPALPKGLPLSLPLKFFLRLSFRLCDKDPARRLDTIDGISREFAGIERKLRYGETVGDKINYRLKSIFSPIAGFLTHVIFWSRKHMLALLCLILLLGGAVWRWRPEPPFDIAKQKNQKYANPDLGLSMTIPAQWEIIPAAPFQEKWNKVIQKNKTKKLNELEQKRLAFLTDSVKAGTNMILCDYSPSFMDNITIQGAFIAADAGEDLFKMSDDDIRIMFRRIYQGELQFKTEIYEIKRMSLAGRRCIFLDFSHDPAKVRMNTYYFSLKGRKVAIVLTAKKSTFAQRREQFESILKTLRFFEPSLIKRGVTHENKKL